MTSADKRPMRATSSTSRRLRRLAVLAIASATLVAAWSGHSGTEPTPTLQASPSVVARGSTATLSWSAPGSAQCVAAGEWDGAKAATGTATSAPLENALNVFSLNCSGPQGRSIATAVVRVANGRQTGLDFPGSQATDGTIRFRFTAPLAMYPATYIWRVYLRSQPEYYTTFFWGNDGEFRWDTDKFPNSYYGAHPYPFPAPNYVPAAQVGPRFWEIAVAGLDVLSEDQVQYGRWHTQAMRVWAGPFGKYHEFYWDLPDRSKVISNRQPRSYGNKLPPKPALTWGDAPWAPSKEIMYGVIRGIQIYSSQLSLAEIQAEAELPVSTPAGRSSIWYLNTDPTPGNILDQSGNGNNPEWVGPERPVLWQTGEPVVR